MYVIGQTGTGKTHFLKSMIYQDIMNGDGVCMIDPHGSDIQDVLTYIPADRVQDVIYFDPAYTAQPMGLNMLEYDTRFPEQKSFVINELLSIFSKLFDMSATGGGGPIFEQFFRNSTGLVLEDIDDPSTLIEISRVLQDSDFRNKKLQKSRNPIINQFWANTVKMQGDQALENFVPYITSKFDGFISNEIMRPIVAQKYSAFNFRQIMDEQKILLVNLSKGRLGELNAHLLGMILVGKIFMAALSRVDNSDPSSLPPFYLYIDEFQNITTDSISQTLSEARKYGLGMTIAHQFIDQIDKNIRDAVFGNVGSKSVFRVGPEDSEIFGKEFHPIITPPDITKLPNYHAYVRMLGNGKPLEPFSMQTLQIPDGDPRIAEQVKKLSYEKYGRPRAEIDTEILERYQGNA